MKTLIIIIGSGPCGKSLLADRLAKSIADGNGYMRAKLDRENMVKLHRGHQVDSVVIFEMVPQYQIEELIQDVDFYKLITHRHVIMTSPNFFDPGNLVKDKPAAQFLIQVLTAQLMLPGQRSAI